MGGHVRRGAGRAWGHAGRKARQPAGTTHHPSALPPAVFAGYLVRKWPTLTNLLAKQSAVGCRANAHDKPGEVSTKRHPRSLVHDARVDLGAARASPRRHGASHPQAVPRPAVARSVSSGRRRPPHQAATPSRYTKPPDQATRPSHRTIIPRRQTKPPPQVTAHDARGPAHTSSTQPPLPSRR